MLHCNIKKMKHFHLIIGDENEQKYSSSRKVLLEESAMKNLENKRDMSMNYLTLKIKYTYIKHTVQGVSNPLLVEFFLRSISYKLIYTYSLYIETMFSAESKPLEKMIFKKLCVKYLL